MVPFLIDSRVKPVDKTCISNVNKMVVTDFSHPYLKSEAARNLLEQ